MTFKIQIKLAPVATSTADGGILGPQSSNVVITTSNASASINLSDPLAAIDPGNITSPELIRWYLEQYATQEPFETSKADQAAETIKAYGHTLAAQIASSNLLPKRDDLSIEVVSQNPTAASPGSQLLRTLHWEVLEDVTLWPREFNFSSVSVYRTVPVESTTTDPEKSYQNGGKKSFNILLVVSRPGQSADIDYQLVSRCLVSIVEKVPKKHPGVIVRLKILRPPAWLAFRELLLEHDPGHFDLVHFDMHGKIPKKGRQAGQAVLSFCKPDISDPLAQKPDTRTASEIGKVLQQARVRNVVLNACDSANARANLAEILLLHEVESVVAMSFKVMDVAVDIFMRALYESLIIRRLSFQQAARISRFALMDNKQRKARYMHVVDLLDYIVPVLYCVRSTSLLLPTSATSKASTHLTRLLNAITEPGIQQVTEEQTIGDIHGRDTDILQIENLLSISKLILIHGPGGCGKTALLHYLCHWWKISGWIKGYAYVDVAHIDSGSGAESVYQSIGEQLRLQRGRRSREELIAPLQTARYLVVLDSVESLTTPIQNERRGDEDLIKSFASFLEGASSGSSMLVLLSRQETTPIAPNLTASYQAYRLDGLSILTSADLLEKMAFQEGCVKKLELSRRHNVEFLRRIAILLEGNPGAMTLVAPGLRKLSGDAELLFNNLLYGGYQSDASSLENMHSSRFGSTVHGLLAMFESLRESLISPAHLAPFWTVMPVDINMFYWFLYLPFSKYYMEGAYANWISDEFQEIVQRSTMGLQLKQHWPRIAQIMIDAGILQPAILRQADSSTLPCYHVHPIFTLITRSLLNPRQQKDVKYAYVRQFILWTPVKYPGGEPEFANVEWNGGVQHEDLAHHFQAVALMYSVDDGDIDEEVDRMGLSLFQIALSRVSMGSIIYFKDRQGQLFAPILKRYLGRLLDTIESREGARGIISSTDLYAILRFSFWLARLAGNEKGTKKVINAALLFTEIWKEANPGAVLDPAQECTWYQLRYMQAKQLCVAEPYRAKNFLEEILISDPDCSASEPLYNAIRRWYLHSFSAWVECVAQIGLDERYFDENEAIANARRFVADFPPGTILDYMSSMLQKHPHIFESMSLREIYIEALEKERRAVAKFGRLTSRILSEPMYQNFADFPVHNMPAGTDKFTAMMQSFAAMTGNQLEAPNPKVMEEFEFGIRALAHDPHAASALKLTMEREAQSSTTSTGLLNLTELHMKMFGAAVLSSDIPDYKKGLTHLTEVLKPTGGAGMSKKQLVMTWIMAAQCYNGLKDPVQTGKAVFNAARILRYEVPASDYDSGEDAERFAIWTYSQVAELDTVQKFTKTRYMWFPPKAFKGLSFEERACLTNALLKAAQVKTMLAQFKQHEEEVESEIHKEERLLKEVLDRYSDMFKATDPSRDWDGIAAEVNNNLSSKNRALHATDEE